ncbi:MAG: alpha/beta hydrolase [Phycisphaerae bacterium]|nr:alpha/beta hydrolase [Phycisphaerae bacterium]
MMRENAILLSLVVGWVSGAAAAAEPIVENISFASGSIQLAGTILLPPGDGPFPGVVLVHGSGTSDRSNPWTSAYAEALVAKGIAVLHPDKRGSGDSGGDWHTASFLELADDAVAAADVLSKHAKTDKTNIGLMGFSQGGHIVPAAAARSKRIAFAVSVSGSSVPIVEQIEDEVMLMAEREGLSSEEQALVRKINDLGFRYAKTSEGWSAYDSALRDARSGPLAGKRVVEGFPSNPDSSAWRFLRAIGDYDPMPYWERLHIPVMFIYGGNDTQIRVAKSVQRIQQRLDPEKSNYTILVFGRNGHALFRDDEIALLADWISARGAS